MAMKGSSIKVTEELIGVLELFCGKWTHVILMVLHEKSHRFGELKNAIPRISTKMLTQSLRALERNGIVTRTVAASIPPRTDYELTALGKELVQHLMPVGKWAKSKMKKFEKARKTYDAANA